MITYLLEHIFLNENMPNIGDATGLRSSSNDGHFYFALHTDNPMNYDDVEVDYTGYSRVAVARTSTGFTVAGNKVFNYADVQFPERIDDGETMEASYFGLHTAATGSGNLFASGSLASPISITQGAIAPYSPGNLVVEISRL